MPVIMIQSANQLVYFQGMCNAFIEKCIKQYDNLRRTHTISSSSSWACRFFGNRFSRYVYETTCDNSIVISEIMYVTRINAIWLYFSFSPEEFSTNESMSSATKKNMRSKKANIFCCANSFYKNKRCRIRNQILSRSAVTRNVCMHAVVWHFVFYLSIPFI